jgi:tape measure domain-containing protein
MSTIAEVRLRLKAEGGKVVAAEVDRVGDSIEGLGGKAIRAEKDTSGAFGAIGKALGPTLGKAAKYGSMAVGALGVQSIYAGVGFNKAFESANASFATFLGSTEKAEEFTNSLRAVSKESPLNLTDYMEAAQLLLGYNQAAEDVVPTLQAVNKAVVATGKGAPEMRQIVDILGSMQAEGTVSKEHLNRLAQAGVPVQDILRKQLGLTNEQIRMIGKEGIKSEKVIKAISEGWDTKYAKAYEDAAKTLAFQLAQLRKDFEQFQREALEPVFEFLRSNVLPTLRQFTGLLISLPQGAKTAMVGLSVFIGGLAAIGFSVQKIRDLKDALALLKPSIVRAAGSMKSLLVTMTKGTIAAIRYTLAQIRLGVTMAAQAIWARTVATAQWLLNAAMAANPIGLVVIGLAALGAAFVAAYKNIGWFRDIVDSAWDAIGDGISWALGFVRQHWPKIVMLLGGPIGAAVVLVVKNFDKIKNAATAVKNWVTGAFNDMVGFMKGLPARISRLAVGMFDGIKHAFQGVFDWIVEKADEMKNIVVDAVPGPLKDALGFSADVGETFFKGFLGAGANGLVADRPGVALVGERGPELVRLGRGDEVIPNELSFGARETVIHLTHILDGKVLSESVSRHVGNAAAAV